MFIAAWLAGLLRRRNVRLLGVSISVALAVALVVSLGAFITTSNAEMTTRAVAGVPVDWQVQLAPGRDATAALKAVRAARGVALESVVGFGDVSSFEATTGASVQTAGAGKAVGVSADYAATFPGEIRYLSGARRGVLLAQQTASNLHVGPGDTITMRLADGRSVSLTVDGIIDLPAADSLFQVVGAPAGGAATAPPDNVIVLPIAAWRSVFGPLAATRPDTSRLQIHLKLAHTLAHAPASAYTSVVARAHNLESQLAGAALVGNNLAAILDAARTDAIYSELLFLFLGLPGVVLAWLLAMVAGASGRTRRRKEQALLRLRGASPRQITTLAFAEAGLVAIIGVLAGLALALLASRFALGVSAAGTVNGTMRTWGAIGAAVGLVLGVVAIVPPARRDARLLTVREATLQVGPSRQPLWQRIYLDLVLIAASGLIFWQSMRSAYQVVLVPEGVPTISINYLTLLAPITFWMGFALLVWRVSDLTLRRGTVVVAAASRPIAGRLAALVTSSMRRRSPDIVRTLVLLALAVSFAVSVGIFNRTYMNQARVDAELTNGADVAVTSGQAGIPADLPKRVSRLGGVKAAEPMQHRLAYVGNDLQDLYGIDPTRVGQATPMPNAFFKGGNAAGVLGALATTSNGLLVSEETVSDFQLQLGDTVRLRMQGPDHIYRTIPFRYVGVAREFPTAPRDSFLVANASYVASATGVGGFETLLVKTSSAPRTVATEVRQLVGPGSGLTVADVEGTLKTTLSGLTAIDLSGLTRIELTVAILLALAASGLMTALSYSERRRTFAITHAIGANSRQSGAFVWSESLFIAAGGVVLGALSGWLEAYIVVRILSGVFDPPPESMSIPWAYLTLVGGIVLASIAAVSVVAIRTAQKPALEVIRDL